MEGWLKELGWSFFLGILAALALFSPAYLAYGDFDEMPSVLQTCNAIAALVFTAMFKLVFSLYEHMSEEKHGSGETHPMLDWFRRKPGLTWMLWLARYANPNDRSL